MSGKTPCLIGPADLLRTSSCIEHARTHTNQIFPALVAGARLARLTGDDDLLALG